MKLILFGIAAATLAFGQQQSVAHQFYSAYGATQMTGLPDEATMRKIGPHLSAGLKQALRAAQAEAARCRAAFPSDKPPFVEGDLFTSNSEGFTRFEVERGGAAVRFEYVEGAYRINWRDELKLVKEGGRWVIDDVRFGRAPGESLRKTLAMQGC